MSCVHSGKPGICPCTHAAGSNECPCCQSIVWGDENAASDIDAICPEPSAGQRMRARRKAQGISMGDVARKAGLSVVQVSDIERDRSACSVEELDRYLRAILWPTP